MLLINGSGAKTLHGAINQGSVEHGRNSRGTSKAERAKRPRHTSSRPRAATISRTCSGYRSTRKNDAKTPTNSMISSSIERKASPLRATVKQPINLQVFFPAVKSTLSTKKGWCWVGQAQATSFWTSGAECIPAKRVSMDGPLRSMEKHLWRWRRGSVRGYSRIWKPA